MRAPTSPSMVRVLGFELSDLLGWLAVLGLSVAIVLVYAPFAAAGFVGTDVLASIETSRVRSLGDVLGLWLRPFGDGSLFVRSDALIYRPLVATLFALDYALWGMDATGYHLTNTLLHLLASLATYAFLRSLTLNRPAALLGAALVAFHPAMAGAVPVLSRRHDPTAVALMLAALALLVVSVRSARPLPLARVASVVLYGLSLGAKETSFGAVLLLPLVVAAAWLIPPNPGAPWNTAPATRLRTTIVRLAITLAPYALVTCLVFGLRFVALGGVGGHRDVDLTPDIGRYRLIIDEYVSQLFWPFRSWYPERTVVWMLVLAVAAPAVILGITALPRRERILATLGCVWVLLYGLFIMATQHKPGPWYLYFPLPGLAMLVAALAQFAFGLRRPEARTPWTFAPLALLVVTLVYLAGLVLRSPVPASYAYWQAAGAVESAFRAGTVECLSETPAGGSVEVNGAPYLLEQPGDLADLLSITWYQEFSVEAALRLAYPDRPLSVTVWSYHSPKSMPSETLVECSGPVQARQVVGRFR